MKKYKTYITNNAASDKMQTKFDLNICNVQTRRKLERFWKLDQRKWTKFTRYEMKWSNYLVNLLTQKLLYLLMKTKMKTMTSTSVTFCSVIHHRICDWLYNANVLQIVLIFYKLIACIMITALLFELPFMYEIIIYENFVYVKTFAAINIIILFDHFRWHIVSLRTTYAPQIIFENEDTYVSSEKIDLHELKLSDVIHFIYDQWWFPVTKAKEILWLTVQQIKQIGDDLEEIWILIRWINNARVVNEDIPREVVEEVISSKDISAQEIATSLIQQWNVYTSLSSAINQLSSI